MHKMYDNHEIQEILSRLERDTNYKQLFLKVAKRQMSSSDYFALLDVIGDGYYERFDRYDSDVCEQFLQIYEKVEAMPKLIERLDSEYGDFPTYEEIKRDLGELLKIVRDALTLEKVKEIQKNFPFLTIEVNSIPLCEVAEDTNIEYVRYEAYGCLEYIYIRADGDIYFDVWSNALNSAFVDSAYNDIDKDKYEQLKAEAEHFLNTGKWK